jgi:hypothetical protein
MTNSTFLGKIFRVKPLQFRMVTDPLTLCIALAACIGELFHFCSVLRLQPTMQSLCADIAIMLGFDS